MGEKDVKITSKNCPAKVQNTCTKNREYRRKNKKLCEFCVSFKMQPILKKGE